jgi:hypothetical protein
MGELLQVTGTINVPLILAMILTMEFVKYVLASEFDIRPGAEVWKYSVLVLGLAAAALTSPFDDIRQVIVDAIMYAAGATIVYQTFKVPIRRLIRKVMEETNAGSDQGD